MGILKIPRATSTELAAITPAQGELVYDTTTGDVVKGDGVTAGGIVLGTSSTVAEHIADTSIHFTQAEISITESQISDLQAYLTAETDPVFTAWDKSTGISITESQISDLQAYLTSETDPVVGAVSGIVKANGLGVISAAVAGTDYLVTETDPVFTAWDKSTGISITESQISDLGPYEPVDATLLRQGDIIPATDVSGAQLFHGFPVPYAVTLSYDSTTRTVTLTPTGASFDVWVRGARITKTGAQTSPAHADVTANYYLWYDAAGDLVWSTTPWNMAQVSPVAYIYYNATTGHGLGLFELHTAERNAEWHASQHFAIGTFVRSGFEISGYTLNTSTDAAITPAIASGMIVDEDIEISINAVADGGPYALAYRIGTTSWEWSTGASFPFSFATAGYIHYNQNNGGTWQLTELGSNQYVNYWLFATSTIDTDKRLLWVIGQNVHSTLSAAQAESVVGIQWGDFAPSEIVGVWRLTYATKNTYATTGKVQLVDVTRLIGTRAQLSGNFSIGSHNALSGRDAADAHPASSISYTPEGNLSAITVQAAITELDSEKEPADATILKSADIGVTVQGQLTAGTNITITDNTISATGSSGGSTSYGLFTKSDPGSVAFTKTAAGTASIKAGTKIEVGGGLVEYASATAITMPTLTAGTDYAIWVGEDASIEATADFVSAPDALQTWRKIGGFHYAPGENATAMAGGNETPAINEYSLWDLKFKPACPDPRGMTLVADSFWADIYLCGVDHITNGTSKYNVTIADGAAPPKIPTKFGGNGSTAYSTGNWWNFAETLQSHGKRPPTYSEFAALAYGTTEATSSGGTDVPTTGVDGTGATSGWEKFTSKWGVIQSSGCLYTWGDEFGGGAAAGGWVANTGGRGSTYTMENVVSFGGNRNDTSNSGSRSAFWPSSPTDSGASASVGARGVADHLILE